MWKETLIKFIKQEKINGQIWREKKSCRNNLCMKNIMYDTSSLWRNGCGEELFPAMKSFYLFFWRKNLCRNKLCMKKIMYDVSSVEKNTAWILFLWIYPLCGNNLCMISIVYDKSCVWIKGCGKNLWINFCCKKKLMGKF